jgi:energy-coupling factor transport system permease protein
VIYQRRASPLHAARAGVAATWALVLAGGALAFDHPLVLATLVGVTLAAGAGARVARRVVAVLPFALPFALLIALVNAFVVREGLTVVWRFGTVPGLGRIDVTLEGLAYGGILALRAVAILLAAALLSAAVDPDGLLRLFRRVSFRSALTAALAVRLVPVLHRDGRRLAEARRCRADRPGRVAVLRAVASGAMDRSVDVAATLELRGYRTGGTSCAPAPPWSRHDAAFAASAVAVLAVAVGGRAFGLAELTPYPLLRADLGVAEAALCAALAAAALLPFTARRGIGS